MATSTAEVVALVDEEALFGEIFIVSCSFPVPCDDEDVDAVASCVGILAVSFSWPESRTGEPFEAVLASRRLYSVRSMKMVAITMVPVLRVRCDARWDVGGSMVCRDSNLEAQLLPTHQWSALGTMMSVSYE